MQDSTSSSGDFQFYRWSGLGNASNSRTYGVHMQYSACQDPLLCFICCYVWNVWPPSVSEELKPYWFQWLVLSTEGVRLMWASWVVIPWQRSGGAREELWDLPGCMDRRTMAMQFYCILYGGQQNHGTGFILICSSISRTNSLHWCVCPLKVAWSHWVAINYSSGNNRKSSLVDLIVWPYTTICEV